MSGTLSATGSSVPYDPIESISRPKNSCRLSARESNGLMAEVAFAASSNHARDDGSAALFRSSWLRLPELAEEPGLGRFPVPDDGFRRYVQDVRRLFDAEAAKEPQLDDLAHTGVEHRQRAQCITESDKAALLRLRQLSEVIDIHANCTGATFLPVSAAGRLDEDPSHHLRRQRQEVRPVSPFDAVDLNQPQVRLVHQGRRLQRMIRSLLAHVASRQPVELAVQEWNQSLTSGFIPLAPGSEELGWLNVRILGHDSYFDPMSPS